MPDLDTEDYFYPGLNHKMEERKPVIQKIWPGWRDSFTMSCAKFNQKGETDRGCKPPIL